MVGPGFFAPYLDAENMMRKPYGCAEQNLFNFAANLYYLKFLKVTNQLKNTVLKDALNFMNLGKFIVCSSSVIVGCLFDDRADDIHKPVCFDGFVQHVIS